MSKKVIVAGKEYDSRTLISGDFERLKLVNHPKVTAIAMPTSDGKIKVTLSIPFGKYAEPKVINFVTSTPKRIDAINGCVKHLKSTVMYRRTA